MMPLPVRAVAHSYSPKVVSNQPWGFLLRLWKKCRKSLARQLSTVQ
jgi:hypothetical protein